jgi:hypothetical protein
MWGGESVKEDMMGKSLMRRALFWEGGSILRRRIYLCGRFFCGDPEFGFGGFW